MGRIANSASLEGDGGSGTERRPLSDAVRGDCKEGRSALRKIAFRSKGVRAGRLKLEKETCVSQRFML